MRVLGCILMILGYGWTLFGICNMIVGVIISFANPLVFISGLILYGPGLIVGALGSILYSINKPTNKPQQIIEQPKPKTYSLTEIEQKRIDELLK